MKKKLKKHVKFINLVWVSSIGLAVFTYFVAISPQLQIKKQINSQLADKEEVLTKLSKINNEQAKAEINQQIQQWQENVNEFVINEDQLAGLTFDIGQIAKDNKVDEFIIVSNDSAMTAKVGTFVSEKQFKVDFKTDFNRFAAFLNAIERHRPVIVINSFSIDSPEYDISTNHVNMIISVYVKKKQGS
ncbi:MAG: hypothetical protein A2Y12_14840 [Planctomycetes bacterium GWF2_42_9]|nr:MAG: hypothetical protein A2Y12_14840 [Planctomycetes bacterium GWF2_42_9]